MALVVNGIRIPDEEIEQEIARLRPHYESYVQDHGEAPDDAQLATWSRENVIERTLMASAAERQVTDVTDEDIRAACEARSQELDGLSQEEARAEMGRRLRIDRLVEKVTAAVPPPTTDELQRYYTAHLDLFVTPEMVRASHIVKHIDANQDEGQAYKAIQEAKAALDAGTPFEEVAATNSDCPDNAGDLGYFARGQMVQEFEDVAFQMQVGQISDVFLSPFGYHIVKLFHRQAGAPAPFEQVRDRLAEQLHNERRGKAVEQFVDSLKEQAEIAEVAEPEPPAATPSE